MSRLCGKSSSSCLISSALAAGSRRHTFGLAGEDAGELEKGQFGRSFPRHAFSQWCRQQSIEGARSAAPLNVTQSRDPEIEAQSASVLREITGQAFRVVGTTLRN